MLGWQTTMRGDLDLPRRGEHVSCSSPLDRFTRMDSARSRPTLTRPISEAGAKITVMSTDELLAEALRLTRVDRARVAQELLSSLEESDEEVATAWATELERRSRDVAEGRVQTTSWDTARTEILKELEQRRASRTTS